MAWDDEEDGDWEGVVGSGDLEIVPEPVPDHQIEGNYPAGSRADLTEDIPIHDHVTTPAGRENDYVRQKKNRKRTQEIKARQATGSVDEFIRSETNRMFGKAPDEYGRKLLERLKAQYLKRSGMRVLQVLSPSNLTAEYETVLYDPQLPLPAKSDRIHFRGRDRTIQHAKIDMTRLKDEERVRAVLMVITD